MKMKHFQNKKDQQRDHAKRRFAERLGVKFSQYLNDMLLNKIYTNQFKFIEKQSNRISVYEMTFTPRQIDMIYGEPKELTVHVVFDRVRKTLVTVAEPGTKFDSCELEEYGYQETL